IAFRNKPVERINVDVQEGSRSAMVVQLLNADPRFVVHVNDADTAYRRWRTGKTDVVIIPLDGSSTGYRFLFDPSRPESALARDKVNDVLQTNAGRTNPVPVEDTEAQEPGSRYIDFLVPGLLGMSLMGGGLWGVGFAIVDMRIRKLLKRFL